jgi:cyclopropane-fatty-acyl-phospholipid synthase
MTTFETTARNPLSAACLGVPMPLPPFAPTAARMLFALLRRVEHGDLLVHTPAGTTHRFGTVAGERCEFTFRDWRLPRRILTGGDVAFAEGYVDGLWDTPDLTALLTLLARNQPALESAFYGRGWQRTLFRLRHWLHANTRRQAKRNIVAHYDLGNAFYARWLDPSMTYSSALFGGDFALSTAAAQAAKYQRILDQLNLASGSQVLEIGAGWGGFAELAGRAGHRVTGLSLSDAQTAYARARIERAGLADRVAFALRDYRDERGAYDGVASIEMFEAVGEQWWPAYFDVLRRVLRPGARAAIQTITIADDRFERYRTQSDFIQQYIFPGGMLASPSRFAAEATRAGFSIAAKLDFGADYAETLKRWLAAFDAAARDLRADGFDERFIRCWRFYLAYCAAGFDSGTIDVTQYTLVAR